MPYKNPEDRKAYSRLPHVKERTNKSSKRWAKNNRERVNKNGRNYYKNNKEKRKKIMDKWLLNNKDIRKSIVLKNEYGITIDDYNQLFINQKGCCKICNNHQSQLKRQLHVDHCHKTLKVRGLLCQKCNTAIGLFEENIEAINNALIYLKESINKPI
jgi:hypothetical protein